MATASTLKAIRRRIGEELGPECYVAGAVSALTTTSVTSLAFLNTNWGSGHFAGKSAVLHRLEATSAADYYRYAGSLTNTSGLIAVAGGANYSDTTVTDEEVEAWMYGVRADQHIHPAINRAMEFIQAQVLIPLSHGSDLDYGMEASTDTNWTDVGSPTTSAKATTARRTPYGMRSYNLINDAANEGTRSATIGIRASSKLSAFAIASANVGTASFQPYDITNSAVVGTAITHGEEEPQLMHWTGNVPATCEEVALYMLGTTNTSDIFWNMTWLYKHDNLRLHLPSYVNEEFKAPTIFIGRPRVNTGTGLWDAQSLDFEELKENRDYRFLMSQPSANPHSILMTSDAFYQYPIFVQVSRPYSDLGALSAETDTTTCPLHLLLPRARMELLDSVYKTKLPGDLFGLLRAKAQEEWERASIARPVSKPARPVRLLPRRRRLQW